MRGPLVLCAFYALRWGSELNQPPILLSCPAQAKGQRPERTTEMDTNKNTAISIDLSTIITYGDLKGKLPSTGAGRVPGFKQLRKKATVLIHRETEGGIIEIFDSGFFTYEECGRITVFGVDRCERRETYTYSGKRTAGEVDPDFSSYPWEMILECAGAARLVHNSESREEYKEEVSLDAPGAENNIAFSVPPDHEIREEKEEITQWRTARRRCMEAALGKLTEKQRTIMMLDRVEKLTQEQIAARVGISRRTLREHLEAIEKKLHKYTANIRH